MATRPLHLTTTITAVFLACGGSTTSTEVGGDLGLPCIPSLEMDKTFNGFDSHEVTVEAGNRACGVDVCLVNHFQGRVSCVYGQDVSGNPPIPPSDQSAPSPGQIGGACAVPTDPKTLVTGNPDPTNIRGASVSPQCVDRTAEKAVYCSCRCANASGRTDDGDSYCACPSGFECAQLVAPVGTDPVAGAYCIKSGSAYDSAHSCSATCDPSAHPCP